MLGPWTLEPFVADDGSVAFGRFMSDLSEGAIDALDLALELVLTVRGIDLVNTEWLKPLGGGLHEFRVTPTYDEVMAPYRSHLSPERLERRRLLEQAYDVAVQVIDLRLAHGLTQGQLAERCGVDQGDISRIERGATNPTARTLQRIAGALDADVRLVARSSAPG